jgi:hypothetical protein
VSADELILSLPPEPEVGTVVEHDGVFGRYVRVETPSSECWRRVADTAERPDLWPWVTVWAAATEEGHTQLRIVPPDPNPLPWSTVHDLDDGSVHILDANNVQLISYKADDDRLAARIMRAVNKAGEQR